MNKIITSAALLMMTIGSFSQAFVSFNTGIYTPATPDVIGTEVNGTKTEVVYGTFGGGIPLTLRLGYGLSDNVTVDLGVTYLIRNKVTWEPNQAGVFPFAPTATVSEQSVSGSGFALNPSVTLKTAGENALGFYTRMGIYFNVGGKSIAEYTTNVGDFELESKGKFSLGFTAGVGASYGLGENLELFGELQYVGLRIRRNTLEVTSVPSAFAGSPIDGLKIDYEDEVDASDVNTSNTTSSNFSSFGLNVGVKYSL